MKLLITSLLFLLSFAIQAKEISDLFADLKTWQADFVQTVINSEQQTETQSEGRLSLMQPNKLRLEYQKPFKQLYVADGQRLWLYDEDLEQVSVKPQEDSLDQTPAMILSRPQQLKKVYDIKHAATSPDRDEFILKPRNAEASFDRIRLLFSQQRLMEMEMFDNFGQRTRLVFNHAQRNKKLSADLFRFIPPKGVDVIGE